MLVASELKVNIAGLQTTNSQDVFWVSSCRDMSLNDSVVPIEHPSLIKANTNNPLPQHAPRHWTQNATAGLLVSEYEEAETVQELEYEIEVAGRELKNSITCEGVSRYKDLG